MTAVVPAISGGFISLCILILQALDLTRMPLTFDSVCLRCAGAWDSYSVANVTKYMNDIGFGFCDIFDDDDSNKVCATFYGLLFA